MAHSRIAIRRHEYTVHVTLKTDGVGGFSDGPDQASSGVTHSHKGGGWQTLRTVPNSAQCSSARIKRRVNSAQCSFELSFPFLLLFLEVVRDEERYVTREGWREGAFE